MTPSEIAKGLSKARVTVRPTPPGVACWFVMHGQTVANKGLRLVVYPVDFPTFDDAWAAALVWAKGGPSPYPRP